MKKTIEKLWEEYYCEVCGVIETEEERALIKRAAEMHQRVSEQLTKEQNDILEPYLELLYEMHSFCGKKGFFTGCEFATGFLLEAINFREP